MYSFIAVISLFIRRYCLSNPFEVLAEGVIWKVGEIAILMTPKLLNDLASIVIPYVTYAVVGIYYERGSNAAVGSFLYLAFYCLHNELLRAMSVLGFEKWCVYGVLALYIGCHVLAFHIKERRRIFN